MKMNTTIVFGLLLAGITGMAQNVEIVNSSFSAPNYTYGNWNYLKSDGLDNGWSWTGYGGGISANSSTWVNTAPVGTQVAFIQLNTTMSQNNISFPASTNYWIGFWAANRPITPADNLALQLDGVTIGYWGATNFTGGSFYYLGVYTNVSAGTHSLSFVGAATGADTTIEIAGVAIGAAPFSTVNSTTLQCNDGSVASIQAAIGQAQDGWTVLVPPGTNFWVSTLNVNKNIQLIGAGMDQTVIVDEETRGSDHLINWATGSSGSARLSGFTFKGGTTNTQTAYDGSIVISGKCHAFRIDDCKFNLLFNANVVFWGWVYGVVDHCTFWRNNTFGVQVHHDAWNGYAYGDGSWAAPDFWGTTNALYIESCEFTNAYAAPGAVDSEGGGRFVFRYNCMTNDYLGTHGTESSGRERSVRSYEIYNNTVYWDTNRFSIGVWAFYLRGGTGVVYSNNVYGYNWLMMAAAYRTTPMNWSWGSVSGQNSWDNNGSGTYYQGTHTGTNNSTLLEDANANWTPNQWVGNTNGGFMLFNPGTGLASAITGNTSNTITCAAGLYGFSLTFSNGANYQIGFVNAVLDQPGLGPGDLVADTSTGNGIPYNTLTAGSGTTAVNWPHETADPIYEWGNNLTGLIGNNFYNNFGGSQSSTVIQNRDWFDGVAKPGYVPLVYPHPLVSGITPVITTGTNTVTGHGAVIPPADLQAHPPVTP